MNKNFKRLIDKLGLQVNITLLEEQLELYSQEIVNECVTLLDAHAQNMEKYNFNDKAKTAHSCSGILLEHFGLDKNPK